MPLRRPSPRLLAVALTSITALPATSCSGPNLASQLVSTPEFQPKDQAKCSVMKSQAEPLIVEWPDAARGKLESMLRRGVVAVRYAGCQMEVLGQCSAKGRYDYAAFTPKRSNVKMRDADDLYANIPAYAVKFEAALKKAGELNVSMTIVGRYEADHGSIGARDLDGACDGATHVITALTVGAFDFYAGADASVGASLGVGEAGVGAKSTAQRETLNQDGSAEACGKSSRDDKEPPYGCGALIRVEVVPLAGGPVAGARPPAETPATTPAEAPPVVGSRPSPTPSSTVSPTVKPYISDQDDDGIVDAADACPVEKGVKSDDPSKNGCPLPRKVVISSTTISILEVIQFASGSAALASSSEVKLDGLARVMSDHPEIHQLAIHGHTDNAESRQSSDALSAKRAEAVKAALVKRGVDAGRLVTKGHGAWRPIAPNDSPVGLAKNRRVDFVVVE